eukprot:3691583-Pyramimonas_sp.AAC.1
MAPICARFGEARGCCDTLASDRGGGAAKGSIVVWTRRQVRSEGNLNMTGEGLRGCNGAFHNTGPWYGAKRLVPRGGARWYA